MGNVDRMAAAAAAVPYILHDYLHDEGDGLMLALLLAPFYIALNVYILLHSLKWLEVCFCCFQPGMEPNPLSLRRLKLLWTAAYTFFMLLPLTSFLLPSSEPQRLLAWLSSFWLGFLLYLSLLILAADVISRLVRRSRLVHRSRRGMTAPAKAEGYSNAPEPAKDEGCSNPVPAPFIRQSVPTVQQHVTAMRQRALTGLLICLCAVSICVYGVHHASDIRVTNYDIALDKTCPGRDSLRVVLAADFHLGCSVGTARMERMTALINEQNADLVCFAGDEFDNSYEALDNPARLTEILSGIRSKYGVYACYGNHDIDERLLAGFSVSRSPSLSSDPRMDRLLEAAGVRLLRDESVIIDDSVCLIGRRDASKTGLSSGRKSIGELMSGVDLAAGAAPAPASNTVRERTGIPLPVIVLDHQPRELDLLEEAGADIALSGHTHDGQLFPANLLVHAAWENPCGLLRKGSLYSVVTSGVGVWGPNMRVLTDSEIVVIDISFK